MENCAYLRKNPGYAPVSGIGLNQYSRYWIESIFQVLNWINIRGIALNHEN